MIYSRDFTFTIRRIFSYYPYIRNYWRGLYFRVPMISRIHAKIKSSRIKVSYSIRDTNQFSALNIIEYKEMQNLPINTSSLQDHPSVLPNIYLFNSTN